jgi:hypothetical protein
MIEAAGAMEAGGEGAEGGTAATGGIGATAGSGGGTAGSGTAGSSTAGSSTGGTAGIAGSGTAGSSTGGTAGTAAGSGGAAAGSAGAGGSPTATGCAKLSVPIDDALDRAHFVISFTSPIDLSSVTTAIISMRVYVKAGVGGTIFSYVQDSGYHFLGVSTAARPALSSLSGWTTLSFNVGTQPEGSSGIIKTDIRRIGIEINAAPQTVWSNPTVVFVDSITVATPALSFTFDAAGSLTATSSGTDVAGQVMWLNNGTTDTTATSATLGWQATCP